MFAEFNNRFRNFCTRLFNWEYWNFGVVYTPVYAVFIWYCIRSGFRFFFLAANPRIQNGGMLLESKYDIYRQLPAGSYPKTLLFKAGSTGRNVVKEVLAAGLSFPLIVKPDIGMKGLAVKKVHNEAELMAVAAVFTVDFLVQELIVYETELGIFWCRYPGEPNGFISGIVGKEMLTVTGNGIDTMAQLLRQNNRYRLQLPALEKEYGDLLQTVLPAGEERVLVPFGNHARGAKFIDASSKATPALTVAINRLCLQIPEFYYGRLDIRCKNLQALERGEDFSIIELNGAGSEPTHIYDPRHSVFFAWKEIIRHWTLLFRISRINHKKGHAYMGYKAGMKMFRDNIRYTRQLELLHQEIIAAVPLVGCVTGQKGGLA